MKRNLLFSNKLLLLSIILFSQCTDPHSRYDDPPWLGGTSIETLEDAGNYEIFLALMDKAEYRVSIENQLFTLFVPNDESFEAYFQKIGVSSVDDLSTNAAEELFGQHILINPRSREQLMYEYAWDELQDPKGEYGTLFHRKRTYAVPLDYPETVKYNEEFKDQTLNLYRRNTMIPLFTTEYFEDYFGDPEGSDYQFMYPGSGWSGTQWHDATVVDAEVRSSTGFIYYLDRVVEPLETIETYLKDRPDEFGLFYDIAQRFANYSNRTKDENDEWHYRKTYNQILDFANEWGPNPDAPANMLYSFSAFIPTNDVLQGFLDNTVLQSYESLDSVPELFLVYLLQSHLNSFLNLPSKMEKRFLNYFGDEIDISIDADIKTAQMCGNGVVYVMNRVLEPDAFTCVPGPIFYNSDYSTFLYAFEQSDLLTTLTNPEVTVTLFAPSDAELLEYGIRYNKEDSDVFIEIRASDGNWKEIEYLDLQDFVKDYIYVGELDDIDGEAFLKMESDNYVYYNNGELFGGGNQLSSDPVHVAEKIPSEKNGNLFYIDNSIQKPLNAAQYMLDDPELTSFAELLYEAKLLDSIQTDYELNGVKHPRVIFMGSLDQWTVFAPTNQAIADAELAGNIPHEQEELRDFLYYHFLRDKCAFDDGNLSGIVQTNCVDTVLGEDVFYETLTLTNTLYNLSVEDEVGNEYTVDHADANKLIESGVLHKLDAILTRDLSN